MNTKYTICKYCGNIITNYKRGVKCCNACKEKGALKLSDEAKLKKREKYIKTLQSKYGDNITNVSQLKEIKEKKKKTLLKNYGVDSPLKSKHIKNKLIETNKKKYGTAYFQQSQYGRIKISKKKNLYDFPYNGKSDLIKQAWCVFCGNIVTISIKNSPLYAICDDCYDNGLKIKFDDDFRIKRNLKTEKTNLEKYGVKTVFQSSDIKQKIEKTNLEKYGVKNVFQSDEIKQKIKQTILKKYNVDNPSQSDEIKRKKEKTSLKNYGETHFLKTNEGKEKLKLAMENKYGKNIYYPYQIPNVKKKMIYNIKKNYFSKILKILYKKRIQIISDYSIEGGYYKNLRFRCERCWKEFESSIFKILENDYKCPFCFPIQTGRSKPEIEIANYIKSLKIGEVIENSRTIIYPKEIDIYIPDKKIAIEFHGLYWHSTASDENINPYYHYDKFKKCYDKNIQLIQIFEDEWMFKQDLVKNKLKYLLSYNNDLKRIHARKCYIKEINSKIKNMFLNQYHIQGGDKAIIKLGAFFENELIAVMTFSHGSIAKGNKKIKEIWELSRFAIKDKYTIPGIAGKLLKYFERNYKWIEIFSYADLRWSIGNLYYNLNFTLKHITKPNYFYVKGFDRIHRFNLRKKPNEPSDIPEWLLRLEDGYHRIWDAGHLKFIKKNNDYKDNFIPN